MEQKVLKDLTDRLRRLEGQVRGIQGMLEKGKDTKQLITQLAAVRSALDKVGFSLIAGELKNELAVKLEGGKSHKEQDLKEIINLFMKLS